MITQEHRGHIDPELRWTYISLPVEIPPLASSIHLRLRYSDRIGSEPSLTHGNTLDLGLIDERGDGFGTMGFRGWSGSEREEIFVSDHEATPGYLSGRLNAGTWYVLVGVYKILPTGCDFELTATITVRDAQEEAPTVPPLLQVAGQPAHAPERPDHWYRGELHCHTEHSDGDSTVAAVVEAAQRLGLDFLAITDHNDVSHHRAMYALQQRNLPALTLIPGCEMTTYYGHWNAWGLSDWVEFRIETADQMRQAMRIAAERGALVSCNHPREIGPAWEFEEVTDFATVEVWNGPWRLNNIQCLAFWERVLATGRQVPAVGGSDMHRLVGERSAVIKIGTPTTWVYCTDAPTPQAILENMRRGHVFISESPSGPRLTLTVNGAIMGDRTPNRSSNLVRLDFTDAEGMWLVVSGARDIYHAQQIAGIQALELQITCDSELYLRAQLQSAPPPLHQTTSVHALTNPVYFDK